jgi:hypothetical protein
VFSSHLCIVKQQEQMRRQILHVETKFWMMVILFIFTISCKEEEEEVIQPNMNFEVDHILKANHISLKTAVVTSEIIEKCKDSLWVEILKKQSLNQTQIDTMLKAIAHQKLVLLSDTVFRKEAILESVPTDQLESYVAFMTHQKMELEQIYAKNKDVQMKKYFEIKMEIMERNISELNEFLETQKYNPLLIN